MVATDGACTSQLFYIKLWNTWGRAVCQHRGHFSIYENWKSGFDTSTRGLLSATNTAESTLVFYLSFDYVPQLL